MLCCNILLTTISNGLNFSSLPNAENVGKLKKMGIKTVISLQGACYPEICNGASEDNDVATEKKNLQDVKIKFVNIPLPLTKEIPNSMIKKFLDTVENKSNQPVYLHCYHGRDRTGTMISLYKIKHQGISGKDAIEEMKTFGFKPENFPFFNKLVLESTPSASYLK
jgi:tyrosine-protein phosphatase SIW14